MIVMGSLSPHRLSATTHRYGTFATRHRHGSPRNDLAIHLLLVDEHLSCCCSLRAKAEHNEQARPTGD